MRARTPKPSPSGTLLVPASDGVPVPVHVFEPAAGRARATVIITGGTAIPQAFYAPFASYLATRGLRAVTFDYRGIGEARPPSLRGFEASMTEWAEKDTRAVVSWARGLGAPLGLVGHSFGGQLLGLIDDLHAVAGAVMVGVQLGYVGHWPLLGRTRNRMLFGVGSLVAGMLGYMPGQLGLGGIDLPKGVAREWASWCRHPDYLMGYRDDARERFARFDRSTLFYSFTDDDLAPRRASQAYLRAISRAPVIHRRLSPAEAGSKVGHFGFFRPRFEKTLWAEATRHLDDTFAGRPSHARPAGDLFHVSEEEILEDLGVRVGKLETVSERGSPPTKEELAAAAAEARLLNTSLGDLEAMRIILRGGSVVDWHRLDLRDHDEVDRFLRVNEFEPSREGDMQRLESLRAEAVDYLVRNFGFRIPDDVSHRVPARDLFLVASRRTRRQVYACIVLKVMHIIHHLAGRELLFRLPISDDEVFQLVERKVVRIVEEIRAAGHPIVQFEWSRKPRDSLVTKLLAKRSTLAANVYDKLRFRLMTRDRSDLLPMLIELTHRLIPFNYVVPGESVNDIIPFRRAVDELAFLKKISTGLQGDIGLVDNVEEPAPVEPAAATTTRMNEFSGPGYRIINFVADLPVRVDSFISRTSDPGYSEYGPIVFVLTEFQIVDARTAHDNETGENSHEKYKERQVARVKARLLRGLSDKSTHQHQAESDPEG